MLLASDGFSRDADDPSDYVATYTPTARVLDSLTPRPRVDRFLDVGTGSGIHALLAAQHARQVIATDVNPRALAYTELNAALNGLHNIECRQGSLFDPVEGETFDLITCNAPYVVSPERRWVYRDSEFSEDEVSERMIAAAADHLAEGGYAALLVSWLAFDEDAPDERVIEWAEASGCDSWILSTLNSDPLTHAAEWNSHLVGEALGEALDEWTRYFDSLGVQLVSEGAVILHKRRRAASTARGWTSSTRRTLTTQAIRSCARSKRARGLPSSTATRTCSQTRVGVASSLRFIRELEPSGGRAVDVEGSVELTEGTKHAVDATADAQEFVASLDSRMRLGEVIAATADRLGLSTRKRRRSARKRSTSRASCSSSARCASAATDAAGRARRASRRSLYNNGITIDREVTMKGASKPKKLGKKVRPEVTEGEAAGQARRGEEGFRLELAPRPRRERGPRRRRRRKSHQSARQRRARVAACRFGAEHDFSADGRGCEGACGRLDVGQRVGRHPQPGSRRTRGRGARQSRVAVGSASTTNPHSGSPRRS